MQNIEPVLHIRDVMRIFGVSQPTVYRWLAESRAGRSRFPLPISHGTFGGKRKLLWNYNDILAFQNAESPQPAKVESAADRKKRYTTAMQQLERQGVVKPGGKQYI